MKCADESSIPTVDGAKAMFAAADEAQANREWCGTESVSTSPATAILDLAERVKGQRPRESLTITEALVSLRESLERIGMPLGALSDLEDAVRHLQAKPDPTAAIVRFLRAEEERFDRGSEDADLGVEGRERCRNKASALRTAVAYIERGDHLAAASVDIYSSFLLTQTTAGVTATLPSPTVAADTASGETDPD